MSVTHRRKCKCPTSKGFYPERDAWRIAPCTTRIHTPTDDRGLVDIPRLIMAANDNELIDPAYSWPIDHPGQDVHHAYWLARWYRPDKRRGHVNPAHFRELPPHKIKIPRVFHNWIHLVTLPPPRPSAEIMAARIEAHRVASDLFQLASNALELEGKYEKWAASTGLAKPNTETMFTEYYIPEIAAITGYMAVLQEMAGGLPPGIRLVEPPTPQTSFTELRETCEPFVAKRHLPSVLPLIVAGRPQCNEGQLGAA